VTLPRSAGSGRLLLASLALLALWLQPLAVGAEDSAAPAPDPLATWRGRSVRSIQLSGNEVTKESVIRREIQTPVGGALDVETLREDVIRLENLSIFAEVRVELEEDGPEGVRVGFVLKESPSWLPIVAFTYTEENGFSIGPGLSALNLTGRGIRLSGKAYFGGTTQYWANFVYPWMYGANHNSLVFNVAHRERQDELRGFHETSDEVTALVGRYLGDHGRASLNFSYFGMTSDVDGITLSPDRSDELLRLGFTLGWDTRDAWRVPRKGWQSELEVWRTGGFLGGDGDFWTGTLDVRRFLPTARGQRLMLSGLASLQSGTLGTDVPVYLDYRMGGANTIRGYQVSDLGKRLSGKNQLIGTAEYSFRLAPVRRRDLGFLSFGIGLELALFADAGIAWSDANELAMNRARGGLGAGLRVLIPGSEMVRLDFGWSPEGGFQFHLGSWSKPAGQRFRLR
jgi:outer membrane protein insertion porin family